MQCVPKDSPFKFVVTGRWIDNEHYSSIRSAIAQVKSLFFPMFKSSHDLAFTANLCRRSHVRSGYSMRVLKDSH